MCETMHCVGFVYASGIRYVENYFIAIWEGHRTSYLCNTDKSVYRVIQNLDPTPGLKLG